LLFRKVYVEDDVDGALSLSKRGAVLTPVAVSQSYTGCDPFGSNHQIPRKNRYMSVDVSDRRADSNPVPARARGEDRWT
jgi:hypothetical protein